MLRRFRHKEEFKDFLKPSELCNLNHPLVRATAEKVTEKKENPEDAAVRVFRFVRDKIPLFFLHPWKTASETLRIRKGSCLTKATLQVALLRCVGIPARFRINEFKGNDPDEWKGILPLYAVSKMPEKWMHYFAEVYLWDRWLMADATFDKALLTDVEDWNGKQHVYSIADKAILLDKGAFPTIETEARKLDEKYRVPVFWRMNSYRFFWLLNLYLKIQRLKKKFSAHADLPVNVH